MKILSISTIPLLPHLGSGKTRINWTQGLKQLGHQVDVIEPKDFELFPKINKGKRFRYALEILIAARKMTNTNNYDLIEYYGDSYWLLLLYFKLFQRKKFVLVAHADGLELLDAEKEQIFWNKKTGLKKWIRLNFDNNLSKLSFKLSGKFVCGCQDDLNYVIEHNLFAKKDAKLIAPGVDKLYHEIPFEPTKEKKIIFVGSWINRKGIKNIPFVINEILNKNETFEFYIFGAWQKKDEILLQFDLNVRNRINISDKLELNELVNEISKASVFFFPTYSEGFGLATIEAMSCGCAIATTKTGIGADLINDEEALLFNFDDITGMINAIQLLISDNELRTRIAFNGYNKAKEFVWVNQIKLLEKAYLNWTNERTPKSCI